MYQDLTVFRMSSAMAAHAGRRQAYIAQNVANSDTPGYRARDLPSFAELVREESPFSALRATRTGHFLGTGDPAVSAKPFEREGPVAPNGNAVSLEEEALMAIETSREHNRAIAVYRSAMSILRLAAGRN